MPTSPSIKAAKRTAQIEFKNDDALPSADQDRPPFVENATAKRSDYVEIDIDTDRAIADQIVGRFFSRIYSWKRENGIVLKGDLLAIENVALRVEGQILLLMADRSADGPIMGRFPIPTSLDTRKTQARYDDGALTIIIPKREAKDIPDSSEIEHAKYDVNIVNGPFLAVEYDIDYILRAALAGSSVSPHILHPDQSSHGAKMLEDDRIITKGGDRYFPLSLAANFAQAPRTTLLTWIKAKVKFEGRSLKTYDSPTARKMYLAEESVERLARRFVKLPSKEPAGEVVIGETDDQTGYVGIAKAARAIGVDHHTVWLWITKGNAPTERPLDVIKCSASDQLYIHEKDVAAIKELVPRSGLRRGRRSRLAVQPR